MFPSWLIFLIKYSNEQINQSKVHGGRCIHGCHWYAAAWSLSMIVVVVALGYFVAIDPLSWVLLRDPHFNSIFIDAFNHTSIALKWTTANSYRFANLQILLLTRIAPKPRGCIEPRFRCRFEIPSWIFNIWSHNSAVVSPFNSDSTSLIKLRAKQEDVVSVHMLDFTATSLHYIEYTSWIPFFILTMVWFSICYPFLFLAERFLVLILDS